MFKEIKRQITLFNTLILIAFLFIFIFLLGFLVQWSLGLSGEVYIQKIAEEIENREQNGAIKEESSASTAVHEKLGYDYIIWDSEHNVSDMKVENNSLIMHGYEMDLDAGNNGEFRIFDVDTDQYRVYSSIYNKEGKDYTVQVFQIINTEQSVIRYIISFLLFIGCGSILVLIPISYFLAGKSLQPIKETFENQKKFIADASHELRTPLTVIQTNVEVLKMKEDEILNENIRWLNNISLETETMAKLISELLLIAQADNKKIAMKKEVFDLSALCAEIQDLMYDVAADHQIHLKGNLQEGICYKGDEERLKQAIRILVDNAIKYTPGEGSVTIGLSEGVRNVSISVHDTGVGLSEEDQKKIFSRFYRVDNARHRESGGVGLGLNIAAVIVKQHNGKIKIDSTIDVGSTFTIVLPKVSLK
ncbi:sensor histidine kinase [Eubacterium barkeri]|uniref:histidine kinase n=1 Tax=Eubacterium barkeri TaxID=1528 RepID=A0A1H3BUL0_EUBBA|nr:HAMP domain-containing sensor histidine kinase [Eubacterium barkeri]SDX45461.1 His Kinase A (phospho-acceptor) domain-containing protein [Eubacterium barkeri]